MPPSVPQGPKPQGQQSNYLLPRPQQPNNSSQFQTPTESFNQETPILSSSAFSSSGVLSSSGFSKPRSGNPTPDTSSFRETPRVCFTLLKINRINYYMYVSAVKRYMYYQAKFGIVRYSGGQTIRTTNTRKISAN